MYILCTDIIKELEKKIIIAGNDLKLGLWKALQKELFQKLKCILKIKSTYK